MTGSRFRIAAIGSAMVVAAVVAGGVRYASQGDTASSADDAGGRTVATAPPAGAAATTTPPPMTMMPDSVGTAPAVADCQEKADELQVREEGDLIDWDALEIELIDPETADELEFTLPTVDGRVATPGERYQPDRFGASLDLASVSDIDLLEAVDICFTSGLLAEEEDVPEDDDPEDEGVDELD